MKVRQKITKYWLSIWLYFMTLVAGILIGLVVVNSSTWGVQMKLIALTTAMLSFHVLEEWRFPGGFHYMYNIMGGSDEPDRYPMNQLSDMWTNLIGTIVGCLMLLIGTFAPTLVPMFALMQCFQAVGELIAHTTSGVKTRRRYANQGKRTIYNPGLFTSWCGYFPLAIALVWSFFIDGDLTVLSIIGALALGAMLMAVSLPLMERICKSEETPYAYTWGDGYFEKFEG